MNSYQIRVSYLLKITLAILVLLNISLASYSQSGDCDPATPFFTVDLTGNPNGTWTSPAVPRVGNCCGTLPPDKCIEFSITLDPAAVAINFQIVSGAVPPGALFYQIGCGPPIAVGSPICLNGPGPYTLTFCKPGNNINTYAITSIAGPSVSPDDTIGNGCSTTMYASGLLVNSSINWTSVYPGATGAYNSYLSCTSACDSTVVTGNATSPPYVDYVVCGTPVAGACVSAGLFCDTIRIHFSPPILNPVTPNPAIFCANTGGILLTGTVNGGVPPYTYAWTNGAGGTGTVVGTGTTYYATTGGTYSFIVYDRNYPACPAQITTVPVTMSPVPVVNAGPDQTICGTSVTLNGTVAGATGGTWSGGNGTFSPSATAGNATYTPTASELTSGTLILTYTSTGNGACSPVSDQVVIHISPPINVTISAPTLLCYGTTATLTANVTGGIAPYFYFWNTGQNTQTISNMLPGTYSITVTGSGGNACSATATVTIVANPQIIVNTSPNNSISCSTTAIISANATGGTGTLNYLWSNGATTTSTIVYTGTYVVTVTDAVGCSANSSVTVIASNSTLTASVNQPPVLCNGATTTLTVAASGGFGAYSYSWNTGATSSSIVAGAGNYCATVTDGGGCTTSACVSVSQNPPLLLNVPTPPVVCNGSTATVTAYSSGGQPPYSYLWSNGQATQSITALAGNYTATVTDAIGCSVSASVTISQATPLNLTMTSTQVSCFGGNNGTATANVTGGTPGFFYSWSPYGGSSATASNLMTGNFTVQVTDAIGCTISSPITVTQPSALNATITVNNNVSCYNGNNGSATVIPTGGTPTYSYSWNPTGGSGQSANSLAAGNYFVTVTDFNGCTQNVTTSITQPSPLTGATSSTTNVSCNGGNNGSATVSASGGTAGYTYSWAPTGGSNATANNLIAGSYTVTITDSKGCTALVNLNITQPPALIINITGTTDVSCYGGANGSATVNVTGGTGPYTYLWSTNGQTTPTANNLTVGNYSVTVTDSKGCVATSSTIAISQPPLLSVTASPSSSISCNSTITISSTANGGSGGYNYQWSNGATTPSITVGTGTYTIVVTDANGCTANNSVSVMASNSTLAVNISPISNICFGSTTTIAANASGGFGSYTYNWSTGAATSSIIGGAGNYCVQVTDGGGCVTNACISVVQNSPVSASIGTPPVVCPGATTSITAAGSGGQAPYSFLWNTGQTNAAISKPAGTYSVTVSDATGSSCSATATVTINQETPMDLSVTSTNVSCYGGNNGTAIVYASAGMPGYTYSWSPSGGVNSSATNLIPNTYTVSVTDAIGCMQTATAVITQPLTAVSITSTSTPVLCYGQSNGTATASGNGGTSPYAYYWWLDGSSDSTITGLSAGTYTVTVADNTGCYVYDSVSVTAPTEIALTGSTTATTCGYSNGSATVIPTGGAGNYTYSWTPAGGTSDTATNLLAGNYTVTVTDANGCQKQLALTVPATPSLLITNFSATATTCFNTATSFTNLSSTSEDSIISWSWNFGEPSSGSNNFSLLQNPQHTYGAAGTYSVTLTVTTAVGCTGTHTGNVIVYPMPVASYSATPTCVNSLTLFTNTSTISTGTITGWSWNFGDPSSGPDNISNIEDPTHVFGNAGQYFITLTVTSNQGCTGTAYMQQTISGSPVAGFTATDVCKNIATSFTDASNVSGSSINSWSWDFGDASPLNTTQNPTHLYLNSGTYNVTLTVTSTSGCIDSVKIPVTVHPLPVALFNAVDGCLGASTSFIDQSTISSGSINTWSWNFGDFSAANNNQNPVYTYSSSGTFNVSLTVTSTTYGCVGTISKILTIHPIPIPNFTGSNACLNDPNVFTDNSISVGDPIAQWIWGFGDGSPIGTTQNPTHLYSNPGPYTVSLVVETSFGCRDTLPKTITVFPLPTVLFSVDEKNGCEDYCPQFNDFSSTLPGSGTITNWTWNFGDNSSSSANQNPQHCYAVSGLYDITLSVTTSNGCHATHIDSALIHVYPVPVADFTFYPQPASTLYSELSFTDQSIGASSWTWNFGDVNNTDPSYLQNPTHNYPNPGNYCVILTVENIYHCIDDTTHCLNVDPEFSFFIPNAFTPGVSFGTNDGFGGAGTNISQYDMWIFDRWGNMIFHTSDLTRKWDGHANNGKNIAQQDVYVYLVELLDFRGNPHKYRGTVTIVR
jgi:large repetitive protein